MISHSAVFNRGIPAKIAYCLISLNVRIAVTTS